MMVNLTNIVIRQVSAPIYKDKKNLFYYFEDILPKNYLSSIAFSQKWHLCYIRSPSAQVLTLILDHYLVYSSF